MLKLTTVTDQHSSQGTELSRHIYKTTHTNRCELKDCRCEHNDHSRSTFLPRYQTRSTHLPNAPTNVELNDFPPKGPNSADTSTKLQAPTGVNLTTIGVNLTTAADQHSSPGTKISWHTYQTHRPMLNLTTVTDQHSPLSTKLSRHTDQTKCTNQCWT